MKKPEVWRPNYFYREDVIDQKVQLESLQKSIHGLTPTKNVNGKELSIC